MDSLPPDDLFGDRPGKFGYRTVFIEGSLNSAGIADVRFDVRTISSAVAPIFALLEAE